MTSGTSPADLPADPSYTCRPQRRDRVCRSWTGATDAAASTAADPASRRHRVCKSWNGYGTLVEEEHEDDAASDGGGCLLAMKPPPASGGGGGLVGGGASTRGGGGGTGGGRWIDALPSLRSLVSRRPSSAMGAATSSTAAAAVTAVAASEVPGAASPSRVPLMHGDPSSHSLSTPSMLTLLQHDAYSLPSTQAISYNPLPSTPHRSHTRSYNPLPSDDRNSSPTAKTSRFNFNPFPPSNHNHNFSLSEYRSYNPLPSSSGVCGGGGGASSDSSDSVTVPMRKCSTQVTLSGGGTTEPVRPVNRLRQSRDSLRMCSRCSSLLSMASSSRYSLNAAAGGFVQVDVDASGRVATPVPRVACKLCLVEVPENETCTIAQCGCAFCKDCMQCYVEFEIQEGAYDISCPDAQCARQGVITLAEIETLVSERHMEKYKRFRLNREVDMDVSRLWCPKAGCETVCHICPTGERCLPQSVRCPTCSCDFCSNCKHPWHGGITCEENTRLSNLLTKEPGIPFDNDLIKCCPMCSVPIEKDEGCAQMMCKRCKHVFCWYCLASLDDDFLLRHYDKGPCKNKLGHSRASVIWHRTQVIGIFAGFGILLLVASPLLLLAAPCIVCCKCRVCSGGSKLDAEDDT